MMTTRRMLVSVCVVIVVAATSSALPIVVNFDDLPGDTVLSGSGYAGLVWEQGNSGYRGNQGYWMTPRWTSNYPYSTPSNVINAWGCTLIGIGFPARVNVLGAYFAGQGDGPYNTVVRIHGYVSGVDVSDTDWFNSMSQTPAWVAMNLMDVDRIVIESVPNSEGGGWYGMDNLTYQIVPEPATLSLLTLGGLALIRRKRP